LTIERADFPQLELAVLSACGTANGSEGTAVDTDSLVRSLQRSGVTYVVASQWKLDSVAAATLMQAFYTEALRGKSVPRCLQLSKNRLRSTLGFQSSVLLGRVEQFRESLILQVKSLSPGGNMSATLLSAARPLRILVLAAACLAVLLFLP
jgi:CHAT domain-containing protein